MRKIRILGLMILLVAMALPAMAQQHQFDPSRMVQRQTQRIYDNVKSLTKPQKKQIQQIFTQNADSVQKIFNNDSLDRQGKFAEMRKLRTSIDAKLKKVFTKDQYAQYENMIQEMRSRYRRRN